MKRALVSLWLVIAGCSPDLTDLDCVVGDDTSCPTGFWCQLHGNSFATCADLGRVPLPDMTLDGIGTTSNPQGTTLTLSAKTYSTVIVRVKNVSTRDAASFNITLDGPTCSGLVGAGANVTDPVDAGSTYEAGIPFVKPSLPCASPDAGTVFFTLEGKQFSSPFTVVVTP